MKEVRYSQGKSEEAPAMVQEVDHGCTVKDGEKDGEQGAVGAARKSLLGAVKMGCKE